MNKIKTNELPKAVAATPAVARKRYDEIFKKQAVENWIKTDL